MTAPLLSAPCCKKHCTYQAKLKPRVACEACWLMWFRADYQRRSEQARIINERYEQDWRGAKDVGLLASGDPNGFGLSHRLRPGQVFQAKGPAMTDTRRAAAEQVVRDWLRMPPPMSDRALVNGIAAALDAAYQQGREDERQAQAESARCDSIPRYTIQQKDASIYFQLVEERDGAWVSFANHHAIVSRLEARLMAKTEATS